MPAQASKVGALVLFCADIAAVADFYRALGVPLETEEHEGGPQHYACELDGCHFALYEGSDGQAPAFRTRGYTFPGFVVTSLDESLAAVRGLGSLVLQEPELYPWGRRCILQDPDGRMIEIYEANLSQFVTDASETAGTGRDGPASSAPKKPTE
ncbi:MAG: VOC family protein [Candidatus Eremiobacteraeota bacterium]|nr:VOC family protein [Candidatus Eremiobacteraeota bacterium]